MLFFRAEKAVKQALLMLCVKNATEQQESAPEAPANVSIAEMQSQTAIPEECKISHQNEDINVKRTRRFFSVLLTLAMLLTLVPAAVSAAGTYPATSAVSVDGKLEREAGENVGNYKILLGTLALKDNGAFKASNYLLSLDTATVYFEIKKAPAPSAPTGLSGMKGKTLATVPLTDGWAWADDTTVMSAAGTQTFKANYTDTTGNYENATNVDVTVEVIDKTNVSASITFADGELTYNDAGQAYETASISGITAGANPGWTYAYVPSGTGSLYASGKPQNAGTYTVTATYEDDDNYGTKSAVLEIKKAETK